MQRNAEPVKLNPAFKDYIWGGEKLKTLFNKDSDMTPLAESWELSCHPNGMSRIASGRWEGRSLQGYIDYYGEAVLGAKYAGMDRFPLLIKLIDAKENLSIQVHPADDYAMEHEGQFGKTEMWYVLESDPGAYLYCGFTRDISREEFLARIRCNTLTEALNRVLVNKGDLFFIPPGTIHAICAGVVIAEIQQNSDVTYRVYDYDRRDANGNARPLHLDKALDVTSLTPPQPGFNERGEARRYDDATVTPLKSCDYFTVSLLDVSGNFELERNDDSFVSLLCLNGSCEIKLENGGINMTKGDCVFIPAGFGSAVVSGDAGILHSAM